MDEIKEKRNYRGFKNFPHYLWAHFVFSVFGIFEAEVTDWLSLKQVVFAPILEEIMYRAVIYGLFRDSGLFKEYPMTCLTCLPLFFAFAHVHILWTKR